MRRFQCAILASLTAMSCLFSTAFAVAATTVSPGTLAFGNVAVNETSAVGTVTFRNTGSAAITINSLAVSVDTQFAIAPSPSTTCGTTLGAGATCAIGVTFKPTATGTQPAGTLTITSTSSSSPQKVTLTGSGITPTTLSATSIAFGNVVLNETSVVRTVTLKNNQPYALPISSLNFSLGASSPFALAPSTTCGSSLGAGATCTIGVTLTPAATGAQADTLNIDYGVSTPTVPNQTVALTGTEIAPTTLSATSIHFGNVVLDETSIVRTVTLKNNQLYALPISSLTFSLGASSPFALASSTTCGSSLAAGATCTIGVTLTPAATGAQADTLNINYGASTPTVPNQPLALTGAEIAPSTLSATSIGFGFVVLNETSVVRTVTLKNNQLYALPISSLTFSLGASSPFALASSTTCSTTTALAAGATCTIGVTLTPASTGAQSDTLNIHYGASTPTVPNQTVALTGTEAAPTTLSATSIGFGNVVLDETSIVRTVTLRNNQLYALPISSLTFSLGASSPFALASSTTCGSSLAAGATCTIGVSLTPASTGAQSDTLNIHYGASTPTVPNQTVSLTGTEITPTTLSATSLAFGTVLDGTTSTARTFTLKNNQLYALPISSLTFSSGPSSPFAIAPSPSTTCGSSLAAGVTCTIGVTFSPATATAQSDTLNIDYGASTPTVPKQTVSLTGTGRAQSTLTPASLAFGNVVISEKSAAQTLTLRNNDASAITIDSIALSQGPASPFAIATTSSCSTATTLAAGATCSINVTLTPPTLGPQSDTLTVTTTAGNTLPPVALSGTGISPTTLSPTSLPFGTVAIGQTSAPLTVSLTNNQLNSLRIASLTLPSGSPFALSASGTTCPNPGFVAAGATCTIALTFKPTASGAQSANLTITTNASNSPQIVGLSGTGGGAALTIATPTTLPEGYAGTAYSQTLVATGGSGTGYTWSVTSGSASLSAVGLSLSTAGAVSGATPVAGSASFTVQVTDSASNTATANFSVTIGTGLSITTAATLPEGYAGTAYSQTLATSGGTNTGLTWTVSSGSTSLTAVGLSVSSGGVVSGATPIAGSASFGVKVTDSYGNTASQTFSVTIGAGLSITTAAALPEGYAGTAYSQTLATSGGTGTGLTWTVTSGSASLSAVGLSVSSGGVVTGATPIAGSASFTVKATDSYGNTASQAFSVTIGAGLSITTAATLPTGYAGTAYSQTLATSGGTGTGLTWTVTSGSASLTAVGLSVSSGGVVSGATPIAGSASLTVKVTDSYGNTASQTFSVTINPALTIATASPLPTGYVGSAYSKTLVATGGSGTGYAWTVTSGAPSLSAVGLSVSGAGVVSGTTPIQGSASFTVQVTDSAGNTASQGLSVSINAGLSITTPATLPQGNAGTQYTQTLATSGGTGTGLTWSVTSGSASLSAVGLSLSSSGVVYGLTPVVGSASFSVTVTDSYGNTASQTFSVTITGVGFVSNVGTALAPQPVIIHIVKAGVANSIQVLTMGAPNLDFTQGSGGTCATAPDFTPGQTCTVKVIFTPIYAGTRNGAVVLADASGNVLGMAYLAGTGIGPQMSFMPGVQNALGSGFNDPAGVAVDGSDNVFVGDALNFAVDEILAAGGYTTINPLGSGFSYPLSLALDGAGNVFVAGPQTNSPVYEILAASGYTQVNTLGSGFNRPYGVAVDGSGNIFVADTFNNAVKEIAAAGGYTTINTLGSGFNTPRSVAVDGSGNVFVLDSGNQKVKEIVAAGGYATINSLIDTTPANGFSNPTGVSVDGTGNVYVVDSGNQNVKQIVAAGGYTAVDTLVTSGSGLITPYGVAVDGSGNLFIAPNNQSSVDKLDFADAPSLSFTTTTAVGATDTTDGPQLVSIQNIGNSPLNFSNIAVSTNFTIDAGATTCSTSTPVGAGASCVVGVDFAPTAAGLLTGTLTLTDNHLNGVNATQSIALSGTGGAPTTLSVTSLSFGNEALGELSASLDITLTNNETTPITIESLTLALGAASPFGIDPSPVECPDPGILSPGASCVIGVTFTPTILAPQSDTLSILTSASATPLMVPLSGAGVPQVSLSPTSLNPFPATFVGQTSTAQTLTLYNNQNIPLTINSESVTGAAPNDFTIGGTCPTAPASIPAGQSCLINVSFNPTASGTRTATLNIGDSAPSGSQAISLTGPGNAPVTVLPGSITNFSAPVGSTSAYQTITITNLNTAVPLAIASLQFSGDFIQSGTSCSTALTAANPSCTVFVQFNPSVGGVRTGQLQVFDNAATSPQVVNFSGTGVSPLTTAPLSTLSPPSLSFSAQTVGTSSAAQTIMLINHETQLETFSLATTGDYSATTNCSTGVIAANSTCLIYVTFTPTSATPSTRTGTLVISNSATSGTSAPGTTPLVAALTGAATLTPPPAAVAVVSPGAGSSGTSVPVVITGNTWTHFSSSSSISFVETTDITTPCDISLVPGTLTATANTINVTLALSGNVYGACNIQVQTPLSGGGTETALLNSAFIIADPTNAHTITSVNPAFGIQGQTLTVAIHASGTHFVQDVTYANFGDGITVNTLTIDPDGIDATANITISNTTPIGYRTITMVTDEEYATSVLSPQGNPIFQIGANSAALLSISPTLSPVTATVVPQGFAGPLYLTASGTHFLQNATTVSIGGVIVGDVLVTGTTTAIVQVAVPASAPVGLQNATVSTGGEIAGLINAITISGATPALVSVVPSSGQQGQSLSVVITGNSFTNFVPGQLTAVFDGNISSPTVNVNSPNQVTIPITIASDANVGTITANLLSGPPGNVTPFPFAFTVTPSSASIVSVTPSSVPQGGQVTLTVVGQNTIWNQADTTAAFYPEPVAIPSVDEITINNPPTGALLNVSVPTNTPPGTYPFYMATGGQIVSSAITVYANTPSMTMSPANGMAPTNTSPNTFPVSFTGQFTHWGVSTFCVIGGEGVTFTFNPTSPVSATGNVVIQPGAPTGARLVTCTTGGEIVTTYFNVTSTPAQIISITPSHLPQNVTEDVTIVGLYTHFALGAPSAGGSQVLFGPQITVNSISNSSTCEIPTCLIANVTTNYTLNGSATSTPPGYQTVYVNTGLEQATTEEQVLAGFGVDAPQSPTILSVVPSSAQQGSTVDVTITGSLTNWVNGTTEAILGAGVTVANLNIVNPMLATATISVSPTAPVGGNSVIMITGTEYDTGTGFSVTPSAAAIVSVEPNFTCPTTAPNNIQGLGCGNGGAPTGVPVVAQLQTLTLNIVGVGTHWLQGETYLSFGPGVAVDALTVSSQTTATAQITVLSSAPVGFASLTSYTAGEAVTLQQAIDIEEGSPILLAFSPGVAEQGATFNLQVLGRFTNWQQGVTSAAFNQDIAVNSVNVIDSETMILNVTVSPWAYVDYPLPYPCGHVLTVTTGSEQVSTSPTITGNNFCVSQGGEEITNVYPLNGAQGTTATVTITGSDTNFLPGVTQVSFGDPNFQVGTVTVNSSTSLTAAIAISTAATNGFKTVTVTTYGQVASQQYSFSVTPTVATLTEAIPNQAEQGVQNLDVHLVGQYTHWSNLSTAAFGPGITVNSVTFTDASDLTANISIDPLSFVGGRTVTVTTPDIPCAELPPTTPCLPNATTGSEIVSLNAFTIIPGPAIITGISPATGNEGQQVVFNITGNGTHWQQNFTQFYIAGGGYDLTINSVIVNSPTSATVDLSISQTALAGARSIFMVTAGESLTDSGAFVVTGGIPVISYVSPNSGSQGTTGLEVTIVGNAYTTWNAGTTVSFGPGVTIATGAGGAPLYQVDDQSHIEAVLNIDPAAQLGYRTVVVTTGTQALSGNFLVTLPPNSPLAPQPTPYIWYESPSSGIPGQTLTIYFAGTNTEWNPDPVTGTQLTGFNSSVTVNTFQVTSATTALANVTISPTADASQSTLTLTTPNTATYGTEVDFGSFAVVLAQPVLSIVDPGTGMQGGQDITVNILGQFTAFDSTTTFSFGPGITVNGAPTILGPGIATQSISIGQFTPTGSYPVTATTPDASGLQQVVGGAYFTVTPSLALISAVTPNTALQGQTVQVDVTGQNTHWDSSTVFTFGAGIVVSNTQVNNETDATLTLVIPPLAAEGPTGVTATTFGEVATITNGFVVQAGTPLLLSSGPTTLPQQSSAVFTILSQATQWTPANPPAVSFGPGVALTNVVVTGPTSLTVIGYVQPTTYVGFYNLTVTTPTQILGINNALYVSPGPAVINSVTPNTAGQGVNLPAVQINGTNTNWVPGITQLSFPGVLINSFTVNAPNLITANITVNDSAPAGQVTVTATTGGEVATGASVFTVTQTQPELLAVVPSSGVQGLTEAPVTLTGDFTHFVNGTTTADFGAGITVNSVTVASSSSTVAVANITIQPTTTIGSRNVTVSTNTGSGTEVVSIANGFQVTTGPAAIAGALNPTSGAQGSSLNVQVTGSQTHFAQGVTTASFGGGIQVTGVTVTGLLSATVSITIPSNTTLGAYNVSLTTGGEVATILGGFTVSSGSPRISVVSPPTGAQGSTNLNVALTGLFTHFVQGTSVANFGSGITVNSLAVTDATDAVANITINQTATIASRNVTVTTGSEIATLTGGFSVIAGSPSLISATPGSAQAGTTANIVINGEFTTFQQGFTTVSFGAGVAVNVVTVNSTTQVTATISVSSSAPVGSQTITVSTNGQVVTLPNGFTVAAGTPVITQINPNIGNPGQTLDVFITGLYTNWVQGTTTANFGSGITVNSVTVSAANSLDANITIGAGAALGPVDVITTTGGEVEDVPGGFTVQAAVIPAPTLLSLSPGANAGGIPINSSFTAVFSAPMNRATINTSTVLLYLESNPSGQVSVTGNVTLDATGRVMTFTPSSLLAVNSQYLLSLTNGIQDATGNAFSYYQVYLYTVFTANTAPPTVVAANPPDNATGVGTNVTVQLEFSTDMNQATQSGMTVSSGGIAIPGTITWNANPYCCGAGSSQPGTIAYFIPTNPLAANTVYTVSYGAPLSDTAGNAVTPGSFNFTTGSGPDTTQNGVGFNFEYNQTNLGTNFAPVVLFSKPINPIDINTSTLLLYNGDSGKYIQGAVTVAPNGMSATFTPTYPLLPDTYYYLHISAGNYDMDGNYLYGGNQFFTTGAGSDLTPPTVASIWPADGAASVPLNAQVTAHFSAPINPTSVSSAITVTPAGGSPISGTATLASDLVTFTFVPTDPLLPNTMYTVQVSGETDMVGNAGVAFSSTFTTANTVAPLNLSTGLDGSGNLITTGDTPDAHWVVTPQGSSTPQPLLVETNGQAAFYPGFLANGPTSSWIAINPDNPYGNDSSSYSTTFNLSGYSLNNLCLVGGYGLYPYGTLMLNGNPITTNTYGYSSLMPLSVALPQSELNAGSNTLSLQWNSSGYYWGGFRLQATVETCGASLFGGLSVVSASPAAGASSVPTNSTITLTFNNPLDPATISDTTLSVMVGWNSNQIIAGSWAVNPTNAAQVTFTPDSPFPANTTIYVGNCNGPYDTAGDTIPCYSVYLDNFTTGSIVTPPSAPFQVIAFAPAANATNVGLRAPVTATFNRSVAPGSINPSSAASDMALFAGDGQSPSCTSISRSQDNSTLSFSSNCYPLPASTIMTAILNSNLTDWAGDPLVNFSNQFTTTQYDSATNGSVISTRPGNGAGSIDPSEPLTIFTNLPIDASTANGGIQVAENNAAITGSVAVLDGGYTLEFTPSSAWTPGALIQWWTNGSLLDSTYETPIGTASGYFYAASSTSTLVPAVQVASPPAYSTIVPPNAIFDLQFSTPLDPATVTSSNIYVYDSGTGLNVPATYSMPQPNEVRIVPQSNVSANAYLTVYVTSGLTSTTSVPASANSWYLYTGAAVDSTLPLVSSAVPYNHSTNVGVNVQPGVIFNKPIDPVSVNGNTFQVTNAGTPLAGGFWFNSNNTRVEFVPNAPLPAGANLAMTINGVLDPVNNPISFSSSFTTGPGPDFTAPTVVSTSVPSAGSIPVNSVITIQFSESMDVTSFSSTNISIYDGLLNVYVPSTLTWNANQSVAYLAPNSPLAAGRQYYLNVNGGTDLAGNPLTGYSSSFYAEFTSANSAPTVIHFNPLSGATGLGTNAIIEAQFNAPIDPTTVNGVTLSSGGNPVAASPNLGAGNTVLQLIPAASLTPNTTYTMTIAGVRDPAGNAVATVSNSFKTGPTYDVNPTTAINSDPSNYATVGTNVTPKLIFDKPLNPLTVNNSTFRMFLYDTGQPIPLNVTESADGTQVTLVPQVPLLANTEYHFQACCGFQDQDGNDGNQIDLYFWTNGSADNSGPTVTVSPTNGATGIPLNVQVQVSISAPIDPTSWTQNSIQLLSGGIPVAGTVSLPAVQSLLFTPTSPLNAGVTYTVNVSGFNDANGNSVVPSSTTFTTGSSQATGGLALQSSSIDSGSTLTPTLSPPGPAITLTFNQVLDPATVNPGTLLVMNSWNSNLGLAATYAVTGNTVTITPLSPYPPGATIYVGATGGLTDVAGDSYGGSPGAGWQQLLYFFTTTGAPDTTPLTVLSVNPASGAANVRPDAPVSVTFNKSINPYTANSSTNNALLYSGQTLQDRGSITMSADNRTMTFNTGALYTGTAYTIDLPAGGISDQSGNTLANTYTSTFTTGVNPATGAGSVQAAEPSSNSTGVPTDSLLTLYMNRQVQASTLPGQLTVSVNGVVDPGNVQSIASGFEIQYTPNTPFPNGAVVQWFLSGSVLDVNGDAFNGNSGTFYTVAAVDPTTAAPAVVALSPSYASNNAPVNTEVDIEFSQPIDGTTLNGNVYLYNGSLGGNPAISVTQPSPNVVRLTPSSLLTPGTLYYACVNTSVKGTNGVAIASGCYQTYFFTNSTSIADNTSGTVAIGPPNGSVNVGTNAYIRLWFSKPVDLTSINSTSVAITGGGGPIPGTWSYTYSGNDVIEANFSPVNPLPPSSAISVSVSGLLDYAGNAFANANSTFTTAALPDYTTPTATLDFGYGQTGIATNASFTCFYTESMDPSSVNGSNTYVFSYVTNARVPVTYTWASDLMAVTMTPTKPLYANSQYLYYCGGAIDLTGNGMSNVDALFYTGNGPSSAGPVLISANPPNGSTNVPLNSTGGPWNNTSLMLLFSEPVSSDSMGNITFTPSGGSAEPIAVVPEYGNTIANVILPWALAPNTTYTFNVAGVMDLNGNPVSGVTTSSFTTGSAFDFTNPTATAATPANGTTTTGVNPVISLTFSEAMNPVLITSSQIYLQTHNTATVVPSTLAISTVAGVTVVTLTPTAPLAESTIYDLVYWPNNWYLYDVAGNYEGQYGVETTFTTGTTAAVNGVCGSANGGAFAMAPIANLCSAGVASSVSNPGSWTWTCNGQYGGNNASCSANVAPGSTPVPQPAGLVSWWPGNDNANDIIGGNNGTLENGVSFALGEVDDAFSLSGNNQFVLIGQPVPSNLQIQNAMTFSAWIYTSTYNQGDGQWATILGSWDNSLQAGAGLFMAAQNPAITGIPPGALTLAIWQSNGSFYQAETTTQLPVNQWTLVTASIAANQPAQLYFNGVAQPILSNGSSLSWNGSVNYSGSAWFAIGQQEDQNRPFNGLIDEAQVYSAALTPAQIQGIYNAGSAGMFAVQTPSTTTVGSSGSPALVGAPVTFTATVSPGAATGTVTFLDGSTTLGSPASLSGGQATFTTSALTTGVHTITALYSGDATYSGSVSSPINQIENLASGSPAAPAATITPSVYFANVETTNLGWKFTVNSSVTVSALGYYDYTADSGLGGLSECCGAVPQTTGGLTESHLVGIYNSSGVLLASATVPAGTAGTLVNDFRYTPITPVTLPPGNYVVDATQENTGIENPTDPVVFEFSTFTTIPQITVPAAGGLYTGAGSYGSLTYPSAQGGYQAYMGPNFQATVP